MKEYNICHLIYFIFIGLSIGIAAANHGAPGPKYNIFASIVETLIGLFLIKGMGGL